MNRLPRKHGEDWIEIYPGYFLSNYGRWYSTKRNQLLKQYKNSSGYLRADLRVDGKRLVVFTHIKVVEHFGDINGRKIPEYVISLFEHGLSIDHIDANKKHNYVWNLELVSHQENCIRRWKRVRSAGI